MKNNNKGFSLVELIVVIAIMAILAAVAVVGFSVYIPKAQQAADKQLVSDVENALNLYMYSDPFVDMPIGKLVLSQNGVKLYGTDGQETLLAGTEVEKALIASFGTNYQNELKLKYDGWTASSSVLNGMQQGEASLVKDSSYMSGNRSDKLLQDVEKFTEMAANLAGAMDESLGSNNTLVSLYGGELLDETAKKYGIYDSIDGSYKNPDGSVKWEEWSAVDGNKQTFSNLLVFAAAVDNQKELSDVDNSHETSVATTLIQEFSTYYAFAATCPEFSPVLDNFMDAMNKSTPSTFSTPYTESITLNPVTNAGTGSDWYSALNTEIAKGYENNDGLTYAEYIRENELNESAATDDQLAFSALLSSLGNVSADDVSGDLGNANLFTQGTVKDKYDEYLNAVDLMYGYSGDFSVNNGEIAIIFNQHLNTVANSIE